jgi:hypothetical protein
VFRVVCGKCQESSVTDPYLFAEGSDDNNIVKNPKQAIIELNFTDGWCYFVCPYCKHRNRVRFENTPKPYPRLGRMS